MQVSVSSGLRSGTRGFRLGSRYTQSDHGASRRARRGFSSLIREALDLYMRQHRAKEEAVAKALQVQGSFSDEEADALQASVRRLRRTWR